MFQVSKESDGLAICLSAKLENIDAASDETKKFLVAVGIQDHAFDILLGMREALNNAVKHGSSMRDQNTVKYHIYFNRGYVTMEIEDEGDGFDWRAKLGERHLPSSDCGRGLAIMEQHFSDVTFSEKGNRLVLKKKIDVVKSYQTDGTVKSSRCKARDRHASRRPGVRAEGKLPKMDIFLSGKFPPPRR